MPENWSKAARRNASDVRGLYGVVRAWEHGATGDRVEVALVRDDDGSRSHYNIVHNGEAVTSRGSIRAAHDSVMRTLRAKPGGL